MPRYILVDNHSGFIFGDSAVFAAGVQADLTPVGAARLFDTQIVGVPGRTYTEVSRFALASNETGYHVYRADSVAVPVVSNGLDQDVVDAVVRDCPYVATLRISEPADGPTSPGPEDGALPDADEGA